MVPNMNEEELEYVGFWPRVWAAVIDSILVSIIVVPLVRLVYGDEYESLKLIQGPADVLISLLLPAIAIVIFWIYRQASPGKMAIGARIVDEKTGGKPTSRQLVVRYLGYYVSTIPLLLGLIAVGFDPKKQGWHDKLAGTVVVRPKVRAVKFGG